MHIGVIGCGRMGSVHVRNCIDHPRVTDIDVVDPAGLPSGLESPGVRWYPEMTPNLVNRWDGAIVATPTHCHPSLVSTLLVAGVPTLCEKPISQDSATTSRLGAQARCLGVVLRSGLQRRFDPAMEALRDLVASGALGIPLSVHSSTYDLTPPEESYLRTSGGIFLDMHIHDFDVVAWLLATSIVSVTAVGADGVKGIFLEMVDHGVTSAGLFTASGAVGTITGSRWSPAGYVVRAGVLGTNAEAQVDARGGLVVSSAQGSTTVKDAGHRTFGFVERFETAYRREIDAFLEEVAGGPARCAGWYDDAAAVRAAESAMRSAMAGPHG